MPIALDTSYEDVHVERNVVTVRPEGSTNEIGAFLIGQVNVTVGATPGPRTCYGYRPLRQVYILDNRQEGVRWGIQLGPNFGEARFNGRVSARVLGAAVPYTIDQLTERSNYVDGTERSPAMEPTRYGLMIIRRGAHVTVEGDTFFFAREAPIISGDDVTVRNNLFDMVLQGGSSDLWCNGSLDLLEAVHARGDGTLGTSTNNSVVGNTFRAPGSSSAMPLSELNLDVGVSGVTLVDSRFEGARYDCALRVAPTDGGVPDGGVVVSESGTTRVPSTMPARCP